MIWETLQKEKDEITRKEQTWIDNNLDMSQTTVSDIQEYKPIYPPTEAEEREWALYVKRWKKSSDKHKEEEEMKKFMENYHLLSFKIKEGT